MTLTAYLNRLVLVRFLVILFTVAGFAILLDLLDVGTKVMRRSDGSQLALLRYMAVRLPTLLTDLVPLTALLASLVAVFDLVRHREIVIVWAAGVSRVGLALRLLPVALLLMTGKLALDDWAVPRTLPELRALGLFELGQPVGASEHWLWLKSGPDVVRIAAADRAAGTLRDVLVFARDPEGRLLERVEAARATPVEGGWRLEGVVRRPAAARPALAVPELLWPVPIDAAQLRLMARLPRELRLTELARAVAGGGFGIGGVDAHRTLLHGRLAGGVTVLLMTFVGVALVHRVSRGSIALPLFGAGLAIGFAAMMLQGTLLAFGEVGLLPAALAAWTAPALLAAALAASTGLLAFGPGASRRRPRPRRPAPADGGPGRRPRAAAPALAPDVP